MAVYSYKFLFWMSFVKIEPVIRMTRELLLLSIALSSDQNELQVSEICPSIFSYLHVI